MRAFRGKIFLMLGLSTSIPLIHMGFFSENITGKFEPKLYYWVVGGLYYVIGCLIFIYRFPERIWKGAFCIIGSSHQIWHIFVILGIYNHYLASLDMFHDRVLNSF
jgi:adiponectin receptor